MDRPAFLITIDTEGDNLWSRPQSVTTRNSEYLSRFQDLCEEFGLKPTYLTNYEMARCPIFQRLARAALQRGTAEVGMHLHAWDTPPLSALTANDLHYQPYLIEYPDHLMRQKVATQTALLEDTFGIRPLSHRAGRWAFDERYAEMLEEKGYRVDCSVTPHVSWKNTPGDPARSGGTDYRGFPERAYWLDRTDISREGASELLELPVTILPGREFPGIPGKVRSLLRRFSPAVLWLRPKRNNGQPLLKVVRRALAEKRSYAEFMLHSSEFMPGGSPNFPLPEDIESLYASLRRLFGLVAQHFQGMTLSEYYEHFRAANGHPPIAARSEPGAQL